MSKIPLRTYIHKIENMLESGKITAAIAHCYQILSSYPRYTETYRLLGKAFLDNKQNDEAELVFNQLLCVFPDDFISHIGLSFLFEEKHDYILAVDHMERAFEIQPSNPSLQDELKRLYKIRDGIEPTRVRLTRGALIKMYARSKLYQQALAEINIALHEHPNRLDLLIELAEMQFDVNLRVEAIETCINIVSKFPYCFEANNILSKALTESSEADDEKIYLQRLIDLDPYIRFTSKDKPDVFSIPDIAITLDENESINIENPIDWKTFLLDCWKPTLKWNLNNTEETIINWDEIIENNFDNDSNITNQSIDHSENLIVQEEEKPTQFLPKNNGLYNLQNVIPSEENIDQGSMESEELNNIEAHENQNIPEWLIEEDLKECKLENMDSSRISPMEINTDENESGLIDQDSPIIDSSKPIPDRPPSTWIQEETIIEQKDSGQEIQEIMTNDNSEIGSQYFDVVLKNAHDALLSDYPQKAIYSYNLLLINYIKNDRLKTQLENEIIDFPQFGELWLILGDVYKNNGDVEKALELYQIAENKFSSGANEQTK